MKNILNATANGFGKFNLFFVLSVIIAIQPSCSILEQMDEMKQFSRCDFKIKEVNSLTIAGFDMEGKRNFSDFSFAETMQLTTALASDDLPAQFTVNLKAENPNSTKASMNKLEWKLFVDDRQMTQGLVDEYIEIPPDGGSAIVPVKASVNLKELLTGQSGKALMNLVANISGKGAKPSKVSMKLSPSIRVGNHMLDYPGYITVNSEVGKK